MSSWSRTIIAPLAILNHYKPVPRLPADKQLHELYPPGLENTDLSLKKDARFWAWKNFFLRCDQILKIYDRLPVHPLRQRALKAAENWMVERMGEGSERPQRDFPAMLNAMMALRVPRLWRGPSAGAKGGPGLCRVCSWMIRRIFAFSPVFRPCGTRPSPRSRWPSPA